MKIQRDSSAFLSWLHFCSVHKAPLYSYNKFPLVLKLIQASFPYLWQKNKKSSIVLNIWISHFSEENHTWQKNKCKGIIRYAFKIMNMTGDYYCSVIGSLLCIYEALACPSALKQKTPNFVTKSSRILIALRWICISKNW